MLDAVVGPANPVVVVTPSGDGLQYALLALAGVLLGALITGGFNFWVARRKELADAAAERRRHDLEVRRAARSIDADLLIAAAAARTTVVKKQWWYGGQPLTSKGWQQYGDVIASDLLESAWQSVIVAVMAIDHLQMARDFAVKLYRMKMATDPNTAAEVAAAIALEIDLFVITTTLNGPPAGSTHWSTRTMAANLGMSASTVQRIWREHRLQPHLVSTFKYSNDPQLEAKVTDIVGLYLNPPERAIVLCVDEKTMIQALDRTRPLLPMKPGQVERRTHDYVRNGTADLYAALDVATGNVTHQFTQRHRAIEFLDFLKLVARTYPRKELHLVVDNSSSHETKEVYAWLRKHPRIHMHFTPTSSSWMNQVETWFSLLNSRAIRRGAFKNVHSLRDAIERFLDAWNDAAHPFKWVKTADDIMAKAKRKDFSDSGH